MRSLGIRMLSAPITALAAVVMATGLILFAIAGLLNLFDDGE